MLSRLCRSEISFGHIFYLTTFLNGLTINFERVLVTTKIYLSVDQFSLFANLKKYLRNLLQLSLKT